MFTSQSETSNNSGPKVKLEMKKQRFAGLSTEEIETLVDNKDSENTKKATKNAITTLEAFCQETSTERPEQLSKEEL